MNFPELYLGTVRREIEQGSVANFMDGIAELNVPVEAINAGDLSEKNKIVIPKSILKVDVLVNNNTYPIPNQDYVDDAIEMYLDKYQSKKVTITDDQVIGASHDRIVDATKSHTEGIIVKKFRKSIWNCAPASTSVNTPVLLTTGADDGTGRKRLTYQDLIRFKDSIDKSGDDAMGRRLVLCSDHWNDMLLDRDNFGDKFINYNKGQFLDIADFEIQKYFANPFFTAAGAKVAFDAIPGVARQASIYFNKSNIAKKTGMTRQYFKPSAIDTDTQSNSLNYRHYFIFKPILTNYYGALVSAAV
jgi:hypothetical protein